MFSWILLNIAHAEEIINPLRATTISGLIMDIANYFLTLTAGVATLAILYGAFLLLSSGGNAEKVTQGRNTIVYALIGVVGVILSVGLVSLVASILGGTA